LEGDAHSAVSGHYRFRTERVYRRAVPSMIGCAAQYRSLGESHNAGAHDRGPLRLAVDLNNLHLLNEVIGAVI